MTFSRTALLVVVAAFLCIGCLNTEYKEYRYKFNSDGTGTGTIKFINLYAEAEDDSTAKEDFDMLVESYLNGTQFSDDNPEYTVKEKRIFMENGQLCGEVTVSFSSAEELGFFVKGGCDCCPLLFSPANMAENVDSTNGTQHSSGGSATFVEWPNGTNEVYIRTLVSETAADGMSLVSYYENWSGKK
jgi:hypothetical protein